MRIESVQTGRIRDIPMPNGTVSTGIDKRPSGAITVQPEGVVGDQIADPDNHGGPGQAVYVYARSDYGPFEALLDHNLAGGSFGENVTVDAWPHDPIRIGDRFAFDGVVLEVTSPRIPCAKFAARMAEIVGHPITGWVKTFTEARRPGWYCRVIEPGQLRAGQTATVTPAPDGTLTGLEMMDLYYDRMPTAEQVQRALAAPIAERSRAYWEG